MESTHRGIARAARDRVILHSEVAIQPESKQVPARAGEEMEHWLTFPNGEARSNSNTVVPHSQEADLPRLRRAGKNDK
jgi:hypothetical protein